MPATRETKNASILDMMSGFPSDSPSADAVWRQALLLRELAREDRSASKQRRVEAVGARAQAEHDAISATKHMCAEMQAQSRIKLQEAEDALQHAHKMKADAEAQARRSLDDAQVKLERAELVKGEAERYAEDLQANARAAADALLAQARVGSQEIVDRMRKETADEIRRVLADVDSARHAAEEELETQRILAETARIRAFSHGMALQAAASEDEATGHRPAAVTGRKVVHFTEPPVRPATGEKNQAAAKKKPSGKHVRLARKVQTPRKMRKAA